MIYEESNKEIPDRVNFQIGDILKLDAGKYVTKDIIGRGGFGTVYKVENESKQIQALKILRLWEVFPNQYPKLVSRFKREHEVGKVNSQFILSTHSYGLINGNPYILMEYCTHGTLDKNLDKFSSRDYGKIFCSQILQGLNSMHNKGIIHRDIKPANILFNGETPKLCDFGISGFLNNRMTQINFFGRIKNEDKIGLGTSIGYSPPEQFEDRMYYKYTLPTMDIYSFGISLFYAFSNGNFPFGIIDNSAKSNKAYKKNQKLERFNPEKLKDIYRNDFWIKILKKCCAASPGKRYQNVSELADSIGIKLDEVQDRNRKFNSKKLEIISTLNKGDIYLLDELANRLKRNILKIGRINASGVKNDLEFTETNTHFISKKHATLERLENRWYVRDGQFDRSKKNFWSYSLNGVYVNEHKIAERALYELKQDDKIRIGGYILKYS